MRIFLAIRTALKGFSYCLDGLKKCRIGNITCRSWTFIAGIDQLHDPRRRRKPERDLRRLQASAQTGFQ